MSRTCARTCPSLPAAPTASANGAGHQLLSTTQLALILGVSARKLERDRQDGTGIPFIRMGRRVLYRLVDVESYVEAQRFTSTAEARRAQGDR